MASILKSSFRISKNPTFTLHTLCLTWVSGESMHFGFSNKEIRSAPNDYPLTVDILLLLVESTSKIAYPFGGFDVFCSFCLYFVSWKINLDGLTAIGEWKTAITWRLSCCRLTFFLLQWTERWISPTKQFPTNQLCMFFCAFVGLLSIDYCAAMVAIIIKFISIDYY